MPLTPGENEAILPIVTAGVHNGDTNETIIKAVVAELRRVRGIPALTPQDEEGLSIIAKQMMESVKEAAARKARIEEGLKETKGELDPSKLGGKRRSGRHRRVTAKRFCGCVKKAKKGSSSKKAEGSAIAVCTSSLLWPHGRTLHSVTCRRKKTIKTQKRTSRKK